MAARAGDIRSRAILLVGYGARQGRRATATLREFARLARQAFALAEESGDPALYMAIAGGAYAFFLHRRATARPWRSAIARSSWRTATPPWAPASTTSARPRGATDSRGWSCASLGELEEARRLIEQGRKIAREQGDVEVVGFSHHVRAPTSRTSRGEPEAALRHARQALEIAERIGNSFSRAYAWSVSAWRSGCEASGSRRSRPSSGLMAIATEGRARRSTARASPLLGESYLGLGDPERARATGRGGARDRARPGEPRQRDVLRAWRWRGSCWAPRAVPRGEEIEAALARALELARDTGETKAFEPLVHVELAELARQRGDRGEARARAARGAPPLHADRRDRPCRAPGGRACDPGELTSSSRDVARLVEAAF